MAEKKYCPLKLIRGIGFCEKERCAWWDSLAGDCAIVVMAKLGLEGSFNAIHKEVVK